MALALLCGMTALGLASSSRRKDPSLRWIRQGRSTQSAVSLLSSGVDRRLGFVTVTGNLVNRSSHPLHHVEAVVELVDDQDRTVGLESGLIADETLPTGLNSAFCVEMQDNERAVGYHIHFRQLLGRRLD